MIVYGDPKHRLTMGEALAKIRACSDPVGKLVMAGQLEQGIADALESAEPLDTSMRLTELCAGELLEPQFHSILRPMERLGRWADVTVEVKTPEGFASYCLYPQQYIEAARRFARECLVGGEQVLVVGVRSIGTSLSAVVQQSVRQLGFAAERLSVRPSGSPYERTVGLPRFQADWLIVVDEGPGQSGSSMAAVARAALGQGFPVERIVFFPRHSGEPGTAAPDWSRELWSRVRRWHVPLDEITFDGVSLEKRLLFETKDAIHRLFLPERPVATLNSEWLPKWQEIVEAHKIAVDALDASEFEIEDVSGGGWRRHAYDREEEWPAVCVPFERTKYMVTTPIGSVLWKFAGLPHLNSPPIQRTLCFRDGDAPELHALRLLLRRSSGGHWMDAALGWSSTAGFHATRWQQGSRLKHADYAGVALTLAAYVQPGGGADLEDYAESFSRLAKMLYVNTRKGLGQAEADRSQGWIEWAARRDVSTIARYRDGRMAPHEFVRTPCGDIVKVDNWGHDCDHTVVGVQPVFWDYAGLIVEWDLASPFGGDTREARLSSALTRGYEPLIHFYVMAYAAFRMGMSGMSEELLGAGHPESSRLAAACNGYRVRLSQALGVGPPG